jgi:hypothetical protein
MIRLQEPARSIVVNILATRKRVMYKQYTHITEEESAALWRDITYWQLNGIKRYVMLDDNYPAISYKIIGRTQHWFLF